MLIIFAGLPGTGKTTLARGLARHLRAVYLRIDSIETGVLTSALSISTTEDAGYRAAYALAADNLHLGHTVITDSVNPIARTRNAYRDIATSATRPFAEVEVVCSDETEHRQRVEARKPDIEGQTIPTWQEVQARAYDEWSVPPLQIDTAGRTPEAVLRGLIRMLPPVSRPLKSSVPSSDPDAHRPHFLEA